ncbi:cytochrome c3 family protein [Bacteroidota bacterium]
MKKTVIFIIVLFLSSISIFAQNKNKVHPSPQSLVCKTCHACEIPTKSDPCLYDCPRENMITVHHAPEEGPDVIMINQFITDNDMYEPVRFTHKLHAEMSGMAGGCSMCHHYNPPGGVLGCVACHETSRKREDVSVPDLKGAYHRQCMDCHREWKREVECKSCHALKGKETDTEEVKPSKDIERVHPKIIEPTKIVYETDTDQGKLVTFFHNEHVHIFNLDCEKCHSNESCARCHDTQKEKLAGTKTLEQHHVVCSACHDTNSGCGDCHSDKEKAPFNHFASTGFNVNKFHGDLNCNDCHLTRGKFSGLAGNCADCHGEFSQENFDHEVTGLILSETHIEFDCSDCHSEPDFSKPACDNCHDEDITYPDYYPGELVEDKN